VASDADAVVIGAGPNGLVAANVLADAGWDVVLCEAEDEPGGAVRSGEVVEPGFVHDRFSSFYPFATISPSLNAFDLQDHGLRWRRAPLVLGHARTDGTAAVLSPDVEETAAGLDADAPGDGDAWKRLMERWDRLEPGFAKAFFTPFPPVLGAARLASAVDPRDLVRLARELALPVRRLAQEHFNGKAAADLLAGTALHADLAPEAVGSGAFGWIMCGLGQRHGFPVPEGGSSRLSDALARRLAARGGSLRCGARVERVLVRGGRARGVRLAGGEELRARRAVIADVDAPTLYEHLLDPSELPRRLLNDLSRFEWDSGTVKVDWTLDGPIPWTARELRRAGTIHVTDGIDDLTRTMGQLSMGQIPDRPFLVMGQYSVTDATRQPAGRETAWAYAHVPQHIKGDAGGELTGRWDTRENEAFADRMAAQLEHAAPGFADLVRRRRVTGPHDLHDEDGNLVGGALNGGSASLHQLAIFRPVPAQLGRPGTPISGLYLASASAHPAGGVHGAPGTIAARAALRSVRNRVGR